MQIDDVVELERRAKADFDRKMEAIAIVKAMMAEMGGKAEAAPASLSHHAAQIDRGADSGEGDERVDPRTGEPVTLIDMIRRELEREDRTWKSSEMVRHLLGIGFNLTGNSQYASVGTALKRLADRGVAYIVRQGNSSGRAHLFRASKWKEPEPAEPAAERHELASLLDER